MSTGLIPLLTPIEKQIIIYGGIIFIFAGLIGNCLNVIVFLSLRTFRQNSCAFYLITMSLLNIGELLTDLLSRIIFAIFNRDGTDSSLIYCKCRLYVTNICTTLSLTCFCLSTIDQYCATCSRPRLQQLCHIKLARYLVVLFGLVWILHAIPYLIYFDHIFSPVTNKITCILVNPIYARYRAHVIIFLFFGILPLTVSVCFGTMAFRNVQQISYYTVPIVRRELDKQLTVMVLLQVFVNLFLLLPFVIVNLISIHMQNLDDSLIEIRIRFSLNIVMMIYFLYFTIPFYLYICASERFRRQLSYVLCKIYVNRWHRLRRPRIIINGITPVL